MKLVTKLLSATALLTASATAMAHPGHTEGGFTSGLLHPMLGLDHLLAMAAIGFWSVRQSKLMKNATPAFVIGGRFRRFGHRAAFFSRAPYISAIDNEHKACELPIAVQQLIYGHVGIVAREISGLNMSVHDRIPTHHAQIL